jgi:transposase-like protein
MPPVDRDNPIGADSSESSYSLMEFVRELPDDAACLEWLWRNRYSEDGSHAYCPKCDRERKFHKVRERPAWDCDSCGYHLHPLAGTIFRKSSTSLHLWFFAVHLMTSTRCGVSAKHLERELGVTYKTAWRMANLIRNKLMTPDQRLLSGYVEVDETSVDGRPRPGQKDPPATDPDARSKAHKLRERSRATVFAAVERGDGSRSPWSQVGAGRISTIRSWSGSNRSRSSTPTSGRRTTGSETTSLAIVERGTQPVTT